MPPNRRERIFEPYYKKNDDAAKADGGLGLAISRRIVREHGGDIEVGGEPGRGATFTLLLPQHSN